MPAGLSPAGRRVTVTLGSFTLNEVLETARLSAPLPFPIPYQGSKRKLAPVLVACFPQDTARLFEPFCGSAAVSIAAASWLDIPQIRLNDTNVAMVALLRRMVEDPSGLADAYEALWLEQLAEPRSFYDTIRDEFNATGREDLFLYLLARCVKAAVRYNNQGQFNQSPDNRRLGSKPERMRDHLTRASKLLAGRVAFTSDDYRMALADVGTSDVVYMDPPYQGVSTTRDRRYADVLGLAPFTEALVELNERDVSYVISYDGRTGSKTHGETLPTSLRLHHFEVNAGPSTQSTLLGRPATTVESVYLSPALVERIGGPPTHLDRAGEPQLSML